MREVFQISSIGIRIPRSQRTTMRTGANILQLLIGFNVLVLGILFFYFFRSAEHTYFLKFLAINHHTHKIQLPAFISLGNSLPTFIHVFALSLITASLIASQKRGYIVVCLAWFAINIRFEFAQSFGETINSVVPECFSNLLLLENTNNYFLQGRFDYLDLLYIALGALAAYIFLVWTIKGNGREHEHQTF